MRAKRDYIIKTAFTDAEGKFIEEIAYEAGYSSVSGYMRNKILTAAALDHAGDVALINMAVGRTAKGPVRADYSGKDPKAIVA